MGRISRAVYKPGVDENGVFLHVYNHCVETSSRDFPFGSFEKEEFFQILKKTLALYSIECLSAVCMSNHYHLILYVPKETFSAKEMVQRLNTFKNKEVYLDETLSYVTRRLEMSNDLSEFMREFQQRFSSWFNKSRPFVRRGTLWQQRFKCSKLADETSLATCLKYIELNPVRAKIVVDPADYPYSTYGIWQLTGKHPFECSFKKHMLIALRYFLKKRSMKGIESYFRGRFAGIIAGENGVTSHKEVDELVNTAREKKGLLETNSYWINSIVLGAKSIIKEHAKQIWGKKQKRRRAFAKAFKTEEIELHSLRKLY